MCWVILKIEDTESSNGCIFSFWNAVHNLRSSIEKQFHHAYQWAFVFVVHLGVFVVKVNAPLSFVYPLQ